MNVQTTTTITLTPEEVKGAIIETLMRLGYSAKPDQIVLQCTMRDNGIDRRGVYLPSTPEFHSAIIKNPVEVKNDRP